MIEAAGGMLWRLADVGVELALVHRPKYDDWSLPKGKLLAGERPFAGGLREVTEETGSSVVLGRYLQEVRYSVSGARKRVRYWAMRAESGDFTPGEEVDALEWLSPRAARRRLSFKHDQQVLGTFLTDWRPTWPLVVVRHASAGRRSAWRGADALRPLDKLGRRQATGVVPLLCAYALDRALSADVVRCLETIAPYVESRGLTVEAEPLFSEDGYRAAPEPAADCLLELASVRRPTVLASQGKAIPGLMKALCAALDAPVPEDTAIRKGGLWVLHLAAGADPRPDIVSMERLDPLTDRLS